MLKIRLADLPALYARIAGTQPLYLPVRRAEQTDFALWTDEAQVDLDTLKTVKSPKGIFFPQSEDLYACHRENGQLSITPQQLCDTPFTVFGMKGCDVQGLAVLDKVFLSDPVDTYYAARRTHGTVVALACGRPEVSCFCTVFGIDPTAPGGDVTCWIADGFLFWQSNTDKGNALTELVSDLFESSDDTAVATQQAATRAILEKLPYHDVSLEGWGAQAADTRFDSPLWEQLYQPCLACGTCTFVCPTCQCYDIRDYSTGNGVQRFRCWDSCMYSDFTMMAHGNNRTSQMQRFRQRFMHKLAYFPANNDGMFSCVGCGRCVDKCPAHLNIVKVLRAFEKED